MEKMEKVKVRIRGGKGYEYFNSDNKKFKVKIEDGKITAWEKSINKLAPTLSHLGCDKKEVDFDSIKENFDDYEIKCINYHLSMQTPSEHIIEDWKGEVYYQWCAPSDGKIYAKTGIYSVMKYIGKNSELARELRGDGIDNSYITESQIIKQ